MTTFKKRRNAGKRISFLMLGSREVGAAEFKARCLELMDEVHRSGVEVVITKHRKPVARLVPVQSESTAFCGSLAGMVTAERDIVSPINVSWRADESNLA